MKHKIPHLVLAGMLGTTLASQAATVVYQSDFTGATLASAGLAQVGVAGQWDFNATDDRVDWNHTARNGRASLYSSDAWQSTGGFTVDVSFLQKAAGSRFSFGIVDANWTVDGGAGWLSQALPGAYGIGFLTSETDPGFSGGDVLAFNDGTSTGVNDFTAIDYLSTAQGDIAFNTLQNVSFTVTSTGWSYSLNGATATTGSMTFDTSKSYRFIAYLQDTSTTATNGTMEGTYYSNITLTAIPEPGTYALLGLGGLAFALRRRRA